MDENRSCVLVPHAPHEECPGFIGPPERHRASLARVMASRMAQGLGPKVTDERALRFLVRMLRPPRALP